MKTKSFTIILIIFFSVNIFADGFIVIPRPNPLPNPFPLEVVYHNVDVKIDGQTAVTKIDQSFYNPSQYQLEGFYIFPIPKGAVINNFTMVINGKETKAELLDSDKARKIYEDIVRQMRDPALLEYSEQNIFKLRIFPIEPRSEKKISISYTQVLESDNNLFEYIYPLNTEKFSAKPLKNVSVNIDLKSEEKLKNIYCPTHDVEVVNKDDYHSIISYEAKDTKPDTDFKLYFSKNQSVVGLSLLNYKSGNKDGYFMLSASPSIEIDKNNIVLMGLSAGAHLALLYSSYNTFMEDEISMKGIQSVVAYYPPSDLKDLFTNDNKSLFARFSVRRTLKGTPTSEEEIYKNYSPISWISEKMIPTLVVHGKLDTVVPFDSSVRLIKKLKSLNVPSAFLVHSKGFHSFDTILKDYTTINIIKKTIRFIKSSIKGEIDNENY